MTEQEIYKTAIDKFGTPHQRLKLVEEMAELTTAIIKYQNDVLSMDTSFAKDGTAILENLYEEFVDVEIVMGQLKYWLGEETLSYHKQKKLARLEAILND